MSPLAEKLIAILEDRDKLAAVLAETRHQYAQKEESIVSLQQQTAKYASELAAIKKQLSVMQNQVAAALLLASDPDDAKLKNRIETLYSTLAPKALAVAPPASSAPAPTKQPTPIAAAEMAASLSPGVPRPSDLLASPPKAPAPPTRTPPAPARPAIPSVVAAQEMVYK